MSQIAHSVAEVQSPDDDFKGSSFFVSPTELITCAHVVRGELAKVRWLGETRRATVVSREDVDISQLKLSAPFTVLPPRILPWAAGRPEPGSEISIAGFNDPYQFSLECLSRRMRGWAQHHDLYVLDQAVPSGFSGSPAVAGESVVGVVVAADPERTLVIPTDAIADLHPRFPPSTAELLFDLGVVRSEVSPGGRSPFAEFTLTNQSEKRLKLLDISLKVERREKLERPHHAHPEGLPEQFELEAKLNPDQFEYELLDAHHLLEPGETEGYKLKLTSEEGWEYSFRLLIRWKPLGEDEVRSHSPGPFGVKFPVQSLDGMLELLEQQGKRKEGDADSD